MRILVTGANGQLGFDVVKELENRGHQVIACGHEQMDVANFEQVCDVMERTKPDAVIHCAAYTAVDKAEEEVTLCRLVNTQGTKNIALACRQVHAKLLYLSSDYVFNGEKSGEWDPDTDLKKPLSVYGKSKADAENVIQQSLSEYFIVRISWVFGMHGNNFVKTMLRLGKERKQLSVVSDQYGAPTYTKDLSVLLADMVVTNQYGIYHASNEGSCSWYEFAREIFLQAGMKEVTVSPILSSEYKTKAVRPKNSRMDKSKLSEHGFKRLPDWKDALQRYLQEAKGEML